MSVGWLRPLAALILSGLLPGSPAYEFGHADDFPSRPLEVVINFAPGGVVDNSVRMMTEGLGKSLGVPVVVTNRAGGGGAVGAMYVAGARPDGYTILASAVGVFNIVPLLNPGLQYKLADFIPLARYANSPTLWLVRKDSPHEKFADLVSYARNNPGKMTCGVAGIGTASDFSMQMMRIEAGIDFVTLPYKGGGELNSALLGGHVDCIKNGIAAVQGLVKAGQMRALAVNAYDRSSNLPDVPSLKELGYPKTVLRIGVGYFLPKGTAASVVDRLGSVFEKVIKSPAVGKTLENLGNAVDYEDGPTFAKSLAEEYKVIEEVGRKAKLIK